MLVSQLIYTGCGKDKTGAFSVWSKSSDITRVEENEIREKMIYKRPTNLPYEPTPEELETLFPKKTGYFSLSSGRYCLAQSVYIGRVYSDLDQRTGNYIIHAFVFDKDMPILPMMYFNSSIFKKGLTYQEWHDQDAPADLPKVEISDGAISVTNQEFQSFFNEDRIDKLEKLLQAVINTLNTKNKISFHDKNSDLKYWYNALSLCLPTNLQKDITFNTIYTPALTVSQMQSNQLADTEVRIRNISPTISSSVFSYRQEVSAGRYGFDFESNIMPEIKVGQYVKVIVDILKNNVFGASRMANTLGKICLECNVDLDTAVTIYLLKNLQISKINDISALVNAIEICKKYYPEIIPNVADGIYDIYFKNVVKNLSSDVIKLYILCYNYSKLADKNKMIENFIVNQRDFGVLVDTNCKEYIEDFIKKAPFDESGFIFHLFNDNYLNKYVIDFKGNFNKEYLLSVYILKGFKKGNGSGVKFNQGYQFIFEQVRYNIEQKNLEKVKYYTDIVKAYDDSLNRKMVLDAIVAVSANKQISKTFGNDFLLRLVYQINDEELSKKIVKQIIIENINEKGFIEKYSALKDENFNLFNKVEEELKRNGENVEFFNALYVYKFENASNINRRDLEKYYDKYVATGLDKGIFIIKLRQYLESIDNKNIVDECNVCYLKWYEDADIKDVNVRKGIKIIADIIFKLDIEILKKHIEDNDDNFAAILYERLKNENYAIPNSYFSIVYGKKIKSSLNKLKKQITEASEKDDIVNMINKIPNKEEIIDLLAKMYKKEVLELLLYLIQIDNVVEIFENIYQKFYNNQEFTDYFKTEIVKLSDEKLADMLSYMIIYVSLKDNITVFNTHMKETLNKILESINSGRRKKIFAVLATKTTNKYFKEINGYLEAYKKTHENVFDKIFGGLFKKKDKNSKESNDQTEDLNKEEKRTEEALKQEAKERQPEMAKEYEEEVVEKEATKNVQKPKYVPVKENKNEETEDFGVYQVNKNKVYEIHHISEDGQEIKRNKR